MDINESFSGYDALHPKANKCLHRIRVKPLFSMPYGFGFSHFRPDFGNENAMRIQNVFSKTSMKRWILAIPESSSAQQVECDHY